ncbi:MAG: ABC transporter ATP-binding protein [Peptococcaceae bacterium]|nr:ABC transporter ATP-binding protein [Peptococcaceae bacterium]
MNDNLIQLSTRNTLSRLWSVLKPNKLYLFISILMSASVSAIMLYAMQRVGVIVDLILSGTITTIFLTQIIILFFLFAAISVVTLIQIYTMAIVGQRLANDLRYMLFSKVIVLPMSYFDKHTTGDLMSRMTNDIDQINTSFSDNFTSLIEAIVNVIGTFLAMALLSVKLTLWAALVFPLFFILTAIVSQISKRLFSRYQFALGEMNTYIEEKLSAQNMLMLFDYKSRNLQKFNAVNETVSSTYAAAQTSSVMAPIMTFINHLIYVIIAIIGGLSIIHGDALTVGTLFTFLLYMRRFATPLNQLASIYNAFQATVSASARIFSVLDEFDEKEALGHNRNHPFPSDNTITFDHVCFSYNTLPILHDISLTLPEKKTIAIVGATGAGKTTLTNLLLSYYLPSSGRILIGGIDLSTITLDEIHRHIGVMPQQPMIFNASILENIGLGNPSSSKEEIIKASKITGFHKIVNELPDSYETILHDQGATLSQGQRQLLAITRALLSQNDILILDEATSSLDSHTEAIVQNAFSQLMKQKTLLIIAHRLSTIKNADFIVVMKQGNLVEAGTHAELLQHKGYYHRLYTSQF